MGSVDVIGRRWSWGGGALHVVCFDDETVAFHEPTASTHVFEEDTRRVLEALRLMGCGVSSLDLWRHVFGAAPSESDCQTLDAAMEALMQAGLVAASPS